MSSRRDWGGLLIAAGMVAMAVWLLSERQWEGILGLVFPLWWGWQIVRDRTLSLDIQGLDVSEGPQRGIPEVEDAPPVCCFCGNVIQDSVIDPSGVEIWTKAGDFEVFHCHIGCFKARLSETHQH